MEKEQDSAKTRALRILGNRDISTYEMETRLIEKGESEQTARETVQWLVEIGYIDDSKYAVQIVRHYATKGYGLFRIKDELHRRGVPRDLWDDALCEIPDISDAAADFLMKKLRGSRDKTDLRRAADALCRRGFGYEEASVAVSRYLEALDEAGTGAGADYE